MAFYIFQISSRIGKGKEEVEREYWGGGTGKGERTSVSELLLLEKKCQSE